MKVSAVQFHWLPRIICMLAIGFISIFAADAFDSEHSVGQQLLNFLIHLIPSFVLLLFLLVAWKWELVGGIIFTAIGIILSPFVFLLNYKTNHFSIAQCTGIILLITFPFILVGILFIISHFKAKKNLLLH